MMTNGFMFRVFGSKIQVVGWTTYTCLICTLKMAVLVFYIRLMVCSNYNPPLPICSLLDFGLDRRASTSVSKCVSGLDLRS
jgi:hypothetical protein